MFKINLSTVLLTAAISVQAVYADDDISSALQKTQDCLRNQNCDAAKTDAGKTAEQKALAIVGGNAANLQELYDLSADIMPMLVQQADGDSVKMQAILTNAQSDPESFLNSLSPEIQAKIKNISSAVEKSKASGQRR